MARKHPLANCDECPLKDRPYVPSTIPSGRTSLVVVGEAPGPTEAYQGAPFRGPSGKLLNQVLQRYGYRRDEVLYTNVVSCHPVGNATPTRAAVAACSERLVGEINEHGANDLLALGGTASTSLIASPSKITSLRVGPPRRPIAEIGEVVQRVVATWHPAYCLRNADAFPAFVSDIGKFREEGTSVWTEPDWRYFDDVPSARAVIGELRQRYDRLVVDIEVGVEKDSGFDHPNHYDLLCVGLAYAPGKAVVLGADPLSDPAVIDDLRGLLQHSRIIAHNGKFDLAGLLPVLGPLELWFDTMLASYCLDERPGNHGLKVLAVEKLGAPKYDDEIKQFVPRGGSYANIPKELLYKYNAMDVACTWALFEIFEKQLAQQDVRKVHDMLVAASNQLMYMELNGITIDKDYSRQLDIEFQERLEKIEAEIDRLVKQISNGSTEGLNPRSPIQIRKFLFACGHSVANTDVNTLSSLLRRVAPGPVQDFLHALLTHRRQAKLYGTYVKGIRRRAYRGRVYTTYMLHGTTSGRLASRNPNLQNIVRDNDIRRQFGVSRPDHVLIQCDYKQAEGRVIATLAEDEYLRGVLSDPSVDIFDTIGASLYGEGKRTKEERIRVKAFFYGLAYGREAASIAAEYRLSVEETERMLGNFRRLIYKTVAWQGAVKKQAISGKPLVSPFGRKRHFWLVTNDNRGDIEREALSFLPQSTASDITLGALVRLRPMLKGLGWLRLTIHDALIAECPESNQGEVAGLLQSVMAEEGRKFTDYVPFPVDVSIGRHWGEL